MSSVLLKAELCFVALFWTCLGLSGQTQVDPQNRHERILAVVPLTGAGTYADPKRPVFADAGKGILEFHWTPSDDGKYAIVEFVAQDRKALAPILTDARTLKAFEKGKAKKDDVESALKAFRKDFSLEEGKKP
jgi:hypothetical protein